METKFVLPSYIVFIRNIDEGMVIFYTTASITGLLWFKSVWSHEISLITPVSRDYAFQVQNLQVS